MPIDAQPRLNLQMLIVFSMSSQAFWPALGMSASVIGIVVQGVFRHVVLVVDDVFHALVFRVLGVDREEDVFAAVGDLAEGGHHGRLVAVADVVLVAVGAVGAVRLRVEHHVAGVDVGAVLLLGKAEGEDGALFQELGRLVLGLVVGAQEDGAQAQGAHLEGVPVGEAVEAEDLGEVGDARGVPARRGVAEARGGEELRHDLVFLHEIEELGVPLARVKVILHLLEAPALEEIDGLEHDLPCFFVGVFGDDVFWV